MIGLEHVLTYRSRQYWQMTEGTLTGEGLRASIAMPGGD
jgi:hypothetical protein